MKEKKGRLGLGQSVMVWRKKGRYHVIVQMLPRFRQNHAGLSLVFQQVSKSLDCIIGLN